MPNQFVARNGIIALDDSIITGSLTVTGSTLAGSFRGSGSGVFTVDGTTGRLFQVDDSLSGSLFSVNTAAGLPVIEAFSDNRVNIGTFNREAIRVSGSFAFITGSTWGTSSWAVSASIAVSASSAPGFTTTLTQAIPATTWSFTHNLNTRNPIVQVYDTSYNQIIPNQVVGVSLNLAEVRFDYPQNGFAVMSNGGGLIVTGSTSQLNQTVAAVTWSFGHNLNAKYVNFEVYDSSDNTITPSSVRVIDQNNAEIYFSYPTTGTAVANFSGINGQMNAQTSSLALTASFVLPLRQTVLITGSIALTGSYTQTGFTTLTTVSQSLNFANDAAAAAGGVPLGGLYRSGNFILIRLS
jgi:hypothetical protein